MALSSALYWSAYAIWISALFGVARMINGEVTEPYMDEIFHVPQAQAYCRGAWSYWDGAITTPPGLYLIPALITSLRRTLSNSLPQSLVNLNPCSLDSLRFLNLSILAVLPLLYTSLLISLRRSAIISTSAKKLDSSQAKEAESTSNTARWEGLVIALMPTVGWWGWLYYTDLGSVALVLGSFRLSLGKKYFASSLVGAASLLFRQTNIVWIAFIAGVALVKELTRISSSPKKRKKTQLYDPFLENARPIDLILTPYSLVYLALHNVSSLIPILSAYVPSFLGFLAFIKLNGGIVLGDKSNHEATVHVPQVYYFIAFSTVFLAPHLVEKKKLQKTFAGLFVTKRRIVTSVNALVVMCWTIRNFTIAHPFLLADNRHYAFYLWRRIINVHPLARYALTPGYLFASRLVYQALIDSKTMRLSTFLLFTLSTLLVLVPTPLIEPRYFLTPFLLLRLYISPPSFGGSPSTSRTSSSRRARLVLEAVLYALVQVACIWLFLKKPFEWDVKVGANGKGLDGRDERELGRKQRFMW
ncbi:hypothetical protein JCM16303_006805 [Sporobolomyces ruberrimus]